LVWLAIIGLAALLPYSQGLSGPFRFDDLANIVHNHELRSVSVIRAFTDATEFSIKPGNWPYRPLTLLLNAVQLKIFGLDSAFGWHLFQILLHAMNSILVALVARRAFGLERGAVAAGLLFALAPIQTSSALYLSAGGPTLALAPALGAILAFVSFMGTDKKKGAAVRLGAVVLLAGISFFCYEGALALPAWLWVAALAGGATVKEKKLYLGLAPVMAVAALYLLLRLHASPGDLLTGHQAIESDYSRFEQVLLQTQVPLKMAELFAWPGGLSFFHRPEAPTSIFDARVVVRGLGLLALVGVIAAGWKMKALAGGLFWYLSALLPGMLVSLNMPWAEHRAYLALPGLAAALGFLWERLENAMRRSKVRLSLTRGVAAAMLLLMATAGASRSALWSSPLGLYRDAVRKTPGFYGSWNLMAVEAETMRANQKPKDPRPLCRSVLSCANMAVKLEPGFADAYNTKLNCLLILGRFEEAESAVMKALELDPDNRQYRHNLEMMRKIREDFEKRRPEEAHSPR